MSLPQSSKDKAVGLVKQSAYGTGEADSSAMTQLRVDLQEPDWNIEDFQDDQAGGARHKLAADHIPETDLALPTFPMAGIVRRDEIADFLYAWFQSVTETGAASPYKRVYDLPVSSPYQPEFPLNQGAFYTLIQKASESADSIKIIDAVLQQLQLSIEPRGKLRLSATWQGNGVPTTNADPTGTWSLSDQEFYKLSRTTHCSYNVTGPDYLSASDVTLILKRAQLTFNNVIEGAGYDATTGRYQQIVLAERNMEFTLTFERTKAAAQALKDARKNGTTVRFKLGWGGATPGDAVGDLHFDFYGRLLGVADDNENYLGLEVTGEMRAKDSSTSPIVVTEGSDIQKTW